MLKLKRIWFLSIHYSMERIPLGQSGRTQWIINGWTILLKIPLSRQDGKEAALHKSYEPKFST